jgi:sortase A
MRLLKYKNKLCTKQGALRILSLIIIISGIIGSSYFITKYLKGYYSNRSEAEYKPLDAIEKVEKIDLTKLESSNSNPVEIIKKIAQNNQKETILYPKRPKIGDEIGELYIPKLDAILPIYHGTSEDELEKGVGHFADSVLPGENDNSVLSGHRDTVFRKLGEVGVGDSLIVTTSAGEFEYKVSKVRIVDKDDRTVIVPKPKATLTVSTCYPFQYIGSAPKRYILVAYLASKTLY